MRDMIHQTFVPLQVKLTGVCNTMGNNPENYSYENMKDEYHAFIYKASAQLGQPPVRIQPWLDQVQVNWIVDGNSMMWRPCNDNLIEVYKGCDYNITYIEIK